MMLRKRVATALTVLALLGIVMLYAGYRDYRSFLATPLKVPQPGWVLQVTPASSIGDIGQRLKQQGVLDAPLYWQVYARLHGLAHRIKAGEYALAANTTPPVLLDQLVQGRVVQYPLTVVEGWTFRRMLKAICDHPKIECTLRGLDDPEIMARLGHPGEHPEGRFFPDTYHFPAGTTDIAFLKRAYAAMEQRLQGAWEHRDPNLSLQTPYEALIVASIIEKETAAPEERRDIAGVLLRRLRSGMLLQTDPTVIYGLGADFDGDIRRADLSRDTPYNTYTRRGLPPTPIALPSAESIAAAVNPAPGDTLYFVATGDGRHVFSKTLEEHNRAVHRHQLKRQPGL
jgi:UPF0755 protein